MVDEYVAIRSMSNEKIWTSAYDCIIFCLYFVFRYSNIVR